MNNDYLDYLSHHGIKGQKWGIRRYQNLDGTLTERGRKHLGQSKRIDANKVKTGLAVAGVAGGAAASIASGVASARNAGNSSSKAKNAFDSGNKWNEKMSASEKATRATAEGLREAQNVASNVSKRRVAVSSDVLNMSDKELRDAVDRMRLENQYVDLSNSRIEPGKVSAEEVLATAGSIAAIAASAATIGTAIYKIKGK